MANQDTRTRPNLDSIAHPEVSRAVRVAYDLIYDAGDAIKAFVAQMIGGAMAQATIAAGAVTAATVTSGGYYQSVPTVAVTGDGAGAKATAILTGNRVTGLTIDAGGAGYTVASFVFTP